jgi:hypothetical protein
MQIISEKEGVFKVPKQSEIPGDANDEDYAPFRAFAGTNPPAQSKIKDD